MPTRLHVSKLAAETTEEHLRKLFDPHGTVVSSEVIHSQKTGQSRGFGYVSMSTAGEAQQAKDNLDNTEFMGNLLRINLAKPREPRYAGPGVPG